MGTRGRRAWSILPSASDAGAAGYGDIWRRMLVGLSGDSVFMLSPVVFATAFVLGAGVIAGWTTVRFPRLAAKRLRVILLHMFAAMVVTQLVGPLLQLAEALPVNVFVALFLVAFPALVYTFLVALWLIRVAQDLLGRMIR